MISGDVAKTVHGNNRGRTAVFRKVRTHAGMSRLDRRDGRIAFSKSGSFGCKSTKRNQDRNSSRAGRHGAELPTDAERGANL